MPPAQLPPGICIITIPNTFYYGAPPSHYLAFDMTQLEDPSPALVEYFDREGDRALTMLYFHREVADPPYPQMITWAKVSATNVVSNPTVADVELVLQKENEYKKERDETQVKREKKVASDRGRVGVDQDTSKCMIYLNIQINELYDIYFPTEAPAPEFPSPSEMFAEDSMPVDIQDSISSTSVHPLSSFNRRDVKTEKQRRQLRRDINKLRRTFGRKVGYRKPLTEVDVWNMKKDEGGWSDTSSDDEDEDGGGRRRRTRRRKKQKHKSKKHKSKKGKRKKRRTRVK